MSVGGVRADRKRNERQKATQRGRTKQCNAGTRSWSNGSKVVRFRGSQGQSARAPLAALMLDRKLNTAGWAGGLFVCFRQQMIIQSC